MSFAVRIKRAGLALGLVWALVAPAQESPTALPSPLRLDYALSLASQPHPVLERAEAEVEVAAADVGAASAAYGVRLGVIAALKRIEPSPAAPTGEKDDSFARLTVQKRLYDFGRTAAAAAAARAAERSRELRLLDTRQQRYLDIMERFFEVLLADLEYTRDNEAMAAAYVKYDKAVDRNELGQVSDIEKLKRESHYQTLRRQRHFSQGKQRAARSRLAIALGRPEDLPSDLEYPELRSPGRDPGDLQALVDAALEHNPRLDALGSQVEAGRQRVRAAERGHSPVLSAELGAAAYANPGGSDDRASASLILEVPLWSGGSVEADVAKQRALLKRAQAELAQARLDVRQNVLDLWLALDGLRVELEEVNKLAEYRELYLDRSRALYAQEVTTDLGDAMTEISDVNLRRAQTELNIELTWARVDALAGRLLSSDASASPGLPGSASPGGQSP